MARARFIRPEFFTDEKIGELPFGARLLFQCIWIHSDLRGVFEHSAKFLRTQAFPYDEGVTSAQVVEWMGLLEAAGMIARFEARGKTWGHVVHWKDHQRISGREVEIDEKMKPEARRPIPPCSPQTVPGDTLDAPRAPSLSLSLSPALSPAPTTSPSPSPAREDSPTTATTAQPRTLGGVKAGDVRKAIDNRDTRALLRMFRCERVDDPAWEREAIGMDHVELAALLTYRAQARDPVRMPSGLGRARRQFWIPELRSEWIAWLNGMMAKYQTAKESA